MRDFHLRGSRFDRATDPVGTGRVVWRVTLKKGKCRFRCDVHPLVMHGSFLAAAPKPTSVSG